MSDRATKQRYNFTLDDETVALLGLIADARFGGNRSEAVRAAVHRMAADAPGWVLSGFTPVDVADPTECHCCHREFRPGDTLYRPVFERGTGPGALPELPKDRWLDCATCAGGHL